MTRSSKRHRPAVVAVTQANDRLIKQSDPRAIPEREIKLPGQIRRMALAPLPNEEILRLRDAPPPPPGYRYTLDGRLVPFEQIEARIDDPEAQAMFCEIVEKTGSLRAAGDALGITSLSKIKAYMTRDIEFCEAVEAACDRHRQFMYAHAVQRATVGIQKPIFGGENKDEIVGYETIVSDSLLAKLLARHFPEFRNNPPPPQVDQATTAGTKLPNFKDMTREQREAYMLLIKEPPKVIDVEAVDETVPDEERDPNEN